MWNYGPSTMMPMQTMQQPMGMPSSSMYGGYSPSYSYSPSYNNSYYNITNIYNNFFANAAMQQPIMQGQIMGGQMPMQPMPTSMFQGQIIGQPSIGNFDQMMQSFMQQLQLLMQQISLRNFLKDLMEQSMMEQTEIIAEAKAWGDPHFNVTNSKGEDLMTDHKGIDDNTYNILDARGNDGLLVDAKYINSGDPNAPQVMGTVRVAAGNEELIFDKDGTATLNGKVLEKGKDYTTKDGTQIKFLENGNIDVISKEKDATIHLIDSGNYLDVHIAEGSRLGNGYKKLGGVLGTLLNHKDDLAKLDGSSRVNDIDGDGISDDLNGDGFIQDNEWARLGYNFDVTATRAIA